MKFVLVILAAFFCFPVMSLANEEAQQEMESEDQAVIVHFQYGSTDFKPVYALESQIKEVLETKGSGELDGNELAVDGSDGYLFLYGSDAGYLFTVIRPILESAPFMKDAVVTLRFGPPEDGVKEEEIVLKSTVH